MQCATAIVSLFAPTGMNSCRLIGSQFPQRCRFYILFLPIASFCLLIDDFALQRPAHLFDLRGICDAAAARAAGLIVYEIGRSEGGLAK
jgi:hypothetical protein